MPPRLPSVVLVLVLLLSGCTAVKSTIHLSEADAALKRADDFSARELAAYEYTMAMNYLEKAREEAGYSDFGMSTALSKKSIEWSDKAIIFIERGGRLTDPEDLSSVPELPAAPAEPAEPEPAAAEPAPADPVPEPEPEPEPGEEFEVEDDFEWEDE